MLDSNDPIPDRPSTRNKTESSLPSRSSSLGSTLADRALLSRKTLAVAAPRSHLMSLQSKDCDYEHARFRIITVAADVGTG